MSYEILEHRADEKFRASGEDLEEAFEGVIEAFSEICSGGTSGDVRHTVETESESLENLLFDFVNDLIYLQETEMVAVGEPVNADVEDLEEGLRIEAEMYTRSLGPENTVMDVKASTYSELEAGYEQGEGWVLQMVIDV